MKTSISVIIPTNNRAPLLLRALTSVHVQTHPAHEIIVVDDGSTDDTATRVAHEYPGVMLIRQSQRGVSAARNRGIEAASGEWIALLDSDDEWLPEKLERQLRALSQSPQTPLCHSDEIWIRNGVRVNPMRKHAKSGGDIFEKCLPLCVISPSAAMMHRSLFREVGTFDETLPACEDYDLWLRVCSRHPVCYVDEPLVVKHGGHDDQLSRRYWGMDRFRVRALARILESPHLDDMQRKSALNTVIAKIDVLLGGARKREKWDVVGEYDEMRRHFVAQLDQVSRAARTSASNSPGSRTSS